MQFLLIALRSEELCSFLKDALRNKYRIVTCSDGKAALDLLNRSHPDALIMDLILPSLDGLSVLEQAGTVPPVILCTTTYISDSVVETAKNLGVGNIILKPCSVRWIVKKFDELTRQQLP